MSTRIHYVWEIRFPGRIGYAQRWHAFDTLGTPMSGRFTTPEGAQRGLDLFRAEVARGQWESWPRGTAPGSAACEARLMVVTTTREVWQP